MLLYDFKLAPSPRRVRMFLAEKGLTIPSEQIDLRGGGQFSEAFRAVNPRCEVPALRLDDGRLITEAAAICRYLEEIHPEPPLHGHDAVERALVMMWDRRMEIDGFNAIAECLRNSNPAFIDRALPGPVPVAQIPALAERGRVRAERFLSALDARLAESPWVAGERFSVADITAFVMVGFGARINLGIADGQAALRRWHEAMSARPSAAA